MAKRGPQSKLTDRNWDEEEEPEEAGIFKQASDDVIQQRVFKRAKRRVPEGNSDQKPSPFGAFSGLISPRADLKVSGEKVAPIKFGNSTDSPKVGFFSGATSSANHEVTSPKDPKDSSYLQSLKSLNESVLAWVKQHVEKNPYIILSPVFKDYEKYLVTIESKKSSVKSSTSDSNMSNSKLGDPASKPFTTSSSNSKTTEEVNSKTEEKEKIELSDSGKSSLFSFGSSSSSTASNGDGFKLASSNSKLFSGGFTFGSSTTTATTASSTSGGFSFAQSVKNGTSSVPGISASSGFSFGNTSSSASTSGFGSLAAAAAQKSEDKEGDEDYVPPKPEVKEIKEQDSVYTKRCKLFYKKDDQWADRGVGNVHLKAVQENKTQIVVRADTNLGNILLNIMLAESLPMSRQGKNNVLIVCTPNPPLKEGDKDPKPVPMLIRVKTEADADHLLAKLEERKKLLS